MHTALVVVDLQNDFCSGGTLAVPAADAVIPVANALMAAFRLVFLTQEWHPPGHVSFASSAAGGGPPAGVAADPAGAMRWPDHCIAGTPGAAFPATLLVPDGAAVVRKGTRVEVDAYSAFFEEDGRTPVGLDDLLRRAGVAEIVLVGLATDVCVCQTALDGRRLGYDVTVLESGCRGIDAQGSLDRAWERMLRAGVRRG